MNGIITIWKVFGGHFGLLAAILDAILDFAAYLMSQQNIFWSKWVLWPLRHGCRHQNHNSVINYKGIIAIWRGFGGHFGLFGRHLEKTLSGGPILGDFFLVIPDAQYDLNQLKNLLLQFFWGSNFRFTRLLAIKSGNATNVVMRLTDVMRLTLGSTDALLALTLSDWDYT